MFDQERLTSDQYLPPWVKNEHLARYSFVASLVQNRRVVDAASGDGTGASTFARAGASRVDAFDVSAHAIDAARARFKLENLDFHVASALALPVESGTADVFVSLETIEHIDEDRAFLAEVRRVLRTDGTFVCSTPNRTVTNPGRSLADRPWNRFHVREYSREEFDALLSEFFHEVEVLGQNPAPGWRIRTMQRVGRVLPGHAPVRINQVLKLPGLLVDSVETHRVQERLPGYEYEYCVAVCRGPRG